ncbi:hypothetical protein [Nocardia ninae]|nr:hypothetical protein [Nocardia ninae]
MSDDYSPDDSNVFELFKAWAVRAEKAYGDAVPIRWDVTGSGIFEKAPEFGPTPDLDPPSEFIRDYTLPVSTTTGAPVNWARVPLTYAKSWFIVQSTGWTPSPLQSSVSLAFLINCANAERSGTDD